jgi:hypothetical protein
MNQSVKPIKSACWHKQVLAHFKTSGLIAAKRHVSSRKTYAARFRHLNNHLSWFFRTIQNCDAPFSRVFPCGLTATRRHGKLSVGANLAQLVEQVIRNDQVVGSSPTIGSTS